MKRCLLALAILLIVDCHLSQAAIVSVGDVTPSIPPDGAMSSATLVVGGAANGSVTVDGAGVLSNYWAIVGRDATSQGMVNVSGANSRWLLGEYLELGAKGRGELVVREGGGVTTKAARLGGGTARLLVSGAESRFSTTLGPAYLGFVAWNSRLDIEDGGRASTGLSYFGSAAPGLGTARIEGTGSVWELEGLEVTGFGDVRVSQGGELLADWVMLGTELNSQSKLEVTDPGTRLTADLTLGGGTSSSSGIVSASEAVIRNGATWNGNVGMGANAAVTANLVVEGVGTTWNFNSASIGAEGTSTLTLRDGAKGFGGLSTLGLFPKGLGKVIVEGPGTEWHIKATNGFPRSGLSLGIYGKGELTIRDGALVTSEVTLLGELIRTSAKVTVTGAGSHFDHGELTIGDRGQDSSLEITDGASAKGGSAIIGTDYGGGGQVLVQGHDSLWQVGYLGIASTSQNHGIVRVKNGGRAEAGLLYIGAGSEAEAEMEVDGADSSVKVDGMLSVGDFGNYANSKLTIKNSANVSSGAGKVGYLLSESSIVEIMGSGSSWEIADGLTIGDRSGLSYTPNNSVLLTGGAALGVGHQLNIYEHSRLTLDAASSAVIGSHESAAASGTVYVATDGVLAGNGSVAGKVRNDGLVSPGALWGKLTVLGDYSQTASGGLSVSLGGVQETEYSRLSVTGRAALAGSLEVSLGESFVPQLGDSFTILTSTQPINGLFTQMRLPGLASGLTWDATLGANSFKLSVVAVPEPEFGGALVLALTFVGLVGHRCRSA